jgi:hypothetical protein
MGDFVISAGGSVDLERFIDRSLIEGKRFKFVSFDHPDVDDPTSGENGFIKVEFRFAKRPNGIKLTPPLYWDHGDGDFKWFKMGDSGTSDIKCKNMSYTADVMYCSSNINSRSVDPGATVEGSQSNQSFHNVELDIEECPAAVLTLKIVGLCTSSAVEISDGKPHKFCSHCGTRLNRSARYCFECGRRV